VPIVIAPAAIRPPTANPELRSEPRKPNHFSRSPASDTAATIGEYEPQKAVRPRAATATTRVTAYTLSASG
jgi:hypothetical protein